MKKWSAKKGAGRGPWKLNNCRGICPSATDIKVSEIQGEALGPGLDEPVKWAAEKKPRLKKMLAHKHIRFCCKCLLQIPPLPSTKKISPTPATVQAELVATHLIGIHKWTWSTGSAGFLSAAGRTAHSGFFDPYPVTIDDVTSITPLRSAIFESALSLYA